MAGNQARLRIAIGRECDPAPVRRPAWTKIAGSVPGQVGHSVRVHVQGPDVGGAAIACRDEHHRLPVGRHGPLIVERGIVGQLLTARAVGMNSIDIRLFLSLGSEDDRLAVGGIRRRILEPWSGNHGTFVLSVGIRDEHGHHRDQVPVEEHRCFDEGSASWADNVAPRGPTPIKMAQASALGGVGFLHATSLDIGTSSRPARMTQMLSVAAHALSGRVHRESQGSARAAEPSPLAPVVACGLSGGDDDCRARGASAVLPSAAPRCAPSRPTRSSPATPRRASWASRCRATGSRSARSCPGPRPASARSPRSRSSIPRYGPLGLQLMRAGPLGARQPEGAARRRSAARRAPGRDGRRAGPRRHAHGRALHPRRRRPVGEGVRGAGEPDGQAERVARHGAGLRGGAGRPRRAAARGARRGGGRGRRHPRPAVGGDRGGEGPRERPALGRPDLRPAGRGQPGCRSWSCGGWCGCSAPTTT